jgi:hypothetical protein
LRITCGTLVLAVRGEGDLGDLSELYAAHAADPRLLPHASVYLDVDGSLFGPGGDAAPDTEWSVDTETGELRVSTPRFLLDVPLDAGLPVRLTLRFWSTVLFDHALRYVIQILAPLRAGAVALHGSSVVRDGVGYAFVAHSETGKTTVARFSQDLGYTVLAEEMTYVAWPSHEAGPRLYSLPIVEVNHLRVARPVSAPLRALYCLVQGTHDRISELPVQRRVLNLAATTFIAVPAPVVMDAALTVIGELAAEIEPKELHFTRSPRFWQVIDAERGPARDASASGFGDG